MSASGRGLGAQVLEERRLLHIGGILVPRVPASARHRQRLPRLVAVEHLAVAAGEQLGLECRGHRVPDLLRAGPDVAEEHRASRPCPCPAARSRRRGRSGPPAQTPPRAAARRGSWPAPTGAPAPRNSGCRSAPRRRPVRAPRSPCRSPRAGGRCCRCRWCSRSPPSGSRALEVRLQARALEVAGHHARSRRQAGLDPGLGAEPLRDRLLREQAGADHHRGIGGVGAAGDRGDHHRAVAQVERLAIVLALDLRRQVLQQRLAGARS